MKKWKDIPELISFLEEEKRNIDYRLDALKSKPSSFEDEIILKYIETRSIAKTAEYVKSKGVRSIKGTVYAASDVSSLIKKGSDNINSTLLRIAREIFDKNFKAVERAYG